MNSDTIHISIVGHNVITRAYNNHMILTQSIDIPYIYSLQKSCSSLFSSEVMGITNYWRKKDKAIIISALLFPFYIPLKSTC